MSLWERWKTWWTPYRGLCAGVFLISMGVGALLGWIVG